jgi:CRP-like cAMP-binding protein
MPPFEDYSCREQLACSSNPFCSLLDGETRALLCSESSSLGCKRRREISFSPEKQDKIMLIRRGEVITFRERYLGRQKGIECLKAGDILGISRLFGAQQPAVPLHIYIKVSAEFCVLPLELFQKLAFERPDFARAVISNVVMRFFLIINQLEHTALDSSEEKILYTLGTLNAQLDAVTNAPAVPPVTHRELAILAGVNRITATRVLEHLRSVGAPVTPANRKHVRGKDGDVMCP